MCEATDDIDDLIEYELTKDCDSMDGDNEGETIFYGKVEMIEEEPQAEYEEVVEDEGEEEEALVDEADLIEGVYDESQDPPKPNIDYQLFEIEEQHAQLQTPPLVETKPNTQKLHKGPRRYLLFDDLVATIVDYDADDTPIVEFCVAGTDSDEKLPVECGICPDVMHKSKLPKHLATHLVPDENRYACIYCEETYKDYKYLAGHARRHMGIRPYVCEPCKLYFSTKQDLRVHNQRRHQKKEHICEICGKTFSQNTMLKRHRESTHEKKRRFKCEHCPKSYYKNYALQEHIRNVHLGKRRMLVCPFCGMQCRDAHKMARHRKELHLNQKYFECHICQEEFTDINYFDAHKRSIQCRNNTRRKLEEDGQAVEQEEQQQQEFLPEQQTQEFLENEVQELLQPQEEQDQCEDMFMEEFVYEVKTANESDDNVEVEGLVDEIDIK